MINTGKYDCRDTLLLLLKCIIFIYILSVLCFYFILFFFLLKLKCCGVSSFTDYSTVFGNSSVPESCCNKDKSSNCTQSTKERIETEIYTEV